MNIYWDWNVDSYLTGLNLCLEFSSRTAWPCKYSASVPPSIFVDEVYGRLQIRLVDNHQDGAKDFFFVDSMIALYICDDCWPDKVTFGVFRVLKAPSIQNYLSSLTSCGSNQLVDPISEFGVANGAQIDSFFVTTPYLEWLRFLCEVRNPVNGISNHDCHTKSHTSLATCTKCSVC